VDPHKPITKREGRFIEEQHKVGEERISKRRELDRQIASQEQQLRKTPKVLQSSLDMAHHKMLRDLETLFMAAQEDVRRDDEPQPEDVISLYDAKQILQELGLISRRDASVGKSPTHGGKKMEMVWHTWMREPSPAKKTPWGGGGGSKKKSDKEKRPKEVTRPQSAQASSSHSSARRNTSSQSARGATSARLSPSLCVSPGNEELSPSIIKVIDPEGSGIATFQRMQALINLYNQYYISLRDKAAQISVSISASISPAKRSRPGRVSASARTRRGVENVTESAVSEEMKTKDKAPTPIDADLAKGLQQMRITRLTAGTGGRRLSGDIFAPEPDKVDAVEKQEHLKKVNKSAVAHVELLFNKRKNFNHRMLRERKKREEDKMKECTFAPTLVARPPKTTAQSRNPVVKGVKNDKKAETFNRLYRTHEVFSQRSKLRKLEKERKEQEILDSYTFQPIVNRPKQKRSFKVKMDAGNGSFDDITASGGGGNGSAQTSSKDDLQSALSFILGLTKGDYPLDLATLSSTPLESPLGSPSNITELTPQAAYQALISPLKAVEVQAVDTQAATPSIFALSQSSVSPSSVAQGSSGYLNMFSANSPSRKLFLPGDHPPLQDQNQVSTLGRSAHSQSQSQKPVSVGHFKHKKKKASVNGFDKTIARMRCESSGSYERRFVQNLGTAATPPKSATETRVAMRAQATSSRKASVELHDEGERSQNPVQFRPSWESPPERRVVADRGAVGGEATCSDEMAPENDAKDNAVKEDAVTDATMEELDEEYSEESSSHFGADSDRLAEMMNADGEEVEALDFDSDLDIVPALVFPTANLSPPPIRSSPETPQNLPPKRNSLVIAEEPPMTPLPDDLHLLSPMSLSSPPGQSQFTRQDSQDVASQNSVPSEASRLQPATLPSPLAPTGLNAFVAKHTDSSKNPESPSPLKPIKPFELMVRL
jgi:hypothetical protein